MSSATPDPLPLGGEQTLDQFCTRALKSSRSNNAASIISKIELLKDVRTRDDHWRHECLVFTVHSPQSDHKIAIYFERGLDNDGTWSDFLLFLKAGMEGTPADTLTCTEVGSDEDVEKRSWSNSIVKVHLRPSEPGPLRVRHIAKVISSESYTTKYPNYGLLSANCWAWARGVLFDIIRHPYCVASEVLVFDTRQTALRKRNDQAPSHDGVPGERLLTKEELELEMLTNFGAYGRFLLHFTSDDFRSRYPFLPYSAQRSMIRLILFFYSLLDILAAVRNTINQFGHSNWTICLRTMHILQSKTTNDKGWDFTTTYLPSNFGRFVPAYKKAFTDPGILNSLCVPGRYLYLLTSPVVAKVSSERGQSQNDDDVNVENEAVGPNQVVATNSESSCAPTWLSCAILRPSANGAGIRDISEQFRLPLLRRTRKPDGTLYYAAMHVLNDHHVLTRTIRNGDSLAVWVHSRDGWKHSARIASIKVVTRKPSAFLDLLLLIYLAWWLDQVVRFGLSRQLTFGILLCCPYVLSTRFEGWIWRNLNVFAMKLYDDVKS
ncbi:hypothetical protein D9613_010705 [Agrocybe pediades]|uniref:Uncharacterized protein n=1 Tax=Agrocybe pediades TaxID=84607 RepID=A0A8H4QMK8_9AGAR|nr:hypothetical protein D9613_010705 [Agrocybe pediades]